jgi:hypothetical protein
MGRQLDLLVPRSDDIFGSPPKLGELLKYLCRISRDRACHSRNSQHVSGAEKRNSRLDPTHRDGSQCVEAHYIIELCLHCSLEDLQAQ